MSGRRNSQSTSNPPRVLPDGEPDHSVEQQQRVPPKRQLSTLSEDSEETYLLSGSFSTFNNSDHGISFSSSTHSTSSSLPSSSHHSRDDDVDNKKEDYYGRQVKEENRSHYDWWRRSNKTLPKKQQKSTKSVSENKATTMIQAKKESSRIQRIITTTTYSEEEEIVEHSAPPAAVLAQTQPFLFDPSSQGNDGAGEGSPSSPPFAPPSNSSKTTKKDDLSDDDDETPLPPENSSNSHTNEEGAQQKQQPESNNDSSASDIKEESERTPHPQCIRRGQVEQQVQAERMDNLPSYDDDDSTDASEENVPLLLQAPEGGQEEDHNNTDSEDDVPPRPPSPPPGDDLDTEVPSFDSDESVQPQHLERYNRSQRQREQQPPTQLEIDAVDDSNEIRSAEEDTSSSASVNLNSWILEGSYAVRPDPEDPEFDVYSRRLRGFSGTNQVYDLEDGLAVPSAPGEPDEEEPSNTPQLIARAFELLDSPQYVVYSELVERSNAQIQDELDGTNGLLGDIVRAEPYEAPTEPGDPGERETSRYDLSDDDDDEPPLPPEDLSNIQTNGERAQQQQQPQSESNNHRSANDIKDDPERRRHLQRVGRGQVKHQVKAENKDNLPDYDDDDSTDRVEENEPLIQQAPAGDRSNASVDPNRPSEKGAYAVRVLPGDPEDRELFEYSRQNRVDGVGSTIPAAPGEPDEEEPSNSSQLIATAFELLDSPQYVVDSELVERPNAQMQAEIDGTNRLLGDIVRAEPYEAPTEPGDTGERGKSSWKKSAAIISLVFLTLVMFVLVLLLVAPRDPAPTQSPTSNPTLAPTPSPSNARKTFENRTELETAVDIYLDSHDSERQKIHDTYGPSINQWQVGQVKDFSKLFSSERLNLAISFNEDIGDWDMSQATSLQEMFRGNALFDQDLSRWDLSSVRDMVGMFQGARAFKGEGIGQWDIYEVTSLERVFDEARALQANLSAWDTSRVENLDYTFKDAGVGTNSLQRPIVGWGLREWNTSSVTSMKGMLQGAKSFNEDITSWNVGLVTDMSSTFQDSFSFNQDISDWNVENVITMASVFERAQSFNQAISGWKIGQLEVMDKMFAGATSFNRPLSGWKTDRVTSMAGVFRGATAFDQDLSSWNTAHVTTFSRLFDGAAAYNGDISSWKTSRVADSSFMFKGAINFNQDLTHFDTSNVTTMESMFEGAATFNGDVSKFDVGLVSSMKRMFANALAFSPKDLTDWHPDECSTFEFMFQGAVMFDADLCDWKTRMKQFTEGIHTPFTQMFNGTACPYPTDPSTASNSRDSMCHKC